MVEWTRLQAFPPAAQVRTLMHDGQAAFVALGEGGVIFYHAPGGPWQPAHTPTTNELRSGLFAMNRFVAVGDRGTVVTSGDGLVWEKRPSGTEANLVAVVAAGPSLLALGEGGALVRSTDGLTWSAQPTGTSQTLRAAAHGAHTYVVVGDAGTVLRSPDGVAWMPQASVTQDALEETQNLAAIAWGHDRWLALGQRPSGLVLRSTDARSWSVELPVAHSGFFLPPLRFEAGRFWAVWQDAAWPVKRLLGSEDASDWTWKWGQPQAGEIGLADFVAQPGLLVSVWLPGTSFPPDYAWNQPAIAASAWSEPGSDAEYRRFSFDTELRSIASGRNRFITVGKAGMMFASNEVTPAAPVLGVSLDPARRRLRVELEGPLDRRVRLEFSPDLANWTYVGTYGSADPPPWFDLPAGPGGANGFYRAALE